jgi:hypothetical protein
MAMPGRPNVVALVALGIVALASTGLHLWGLGADLPYAPDGDERIFISAAVRMLHDGTLNPGWFGNPGSTVIYPAAALIESWYQLAKHLPFLVHPTGGIQATFVNDPTPFYMIGRLISVAYGVGSVVATWLVARRFVGDAGAVIAAAFVAGTPIVVSFGQVVRTDTAGMFFALSSIWLILRAGERADITSWAIAAISVGVAMSTRYFFATLMIPYAIGLWIWWTKTRGREALSSVRSRATVPLLGTFTLAPLAFALTSPFFFIDLHRAIANLRHEARTIHPGADGLSPIANFGWYLGTMLPTALGLVAVALAAVGMVIVVRRNQATAAVLLGYAVSYLIGVSASPLHWGRYVIPLVPVVGILATSTVLAGAAAASRLLTSRIRSVDGTASPNGERFPSKHRRAITIGLAASTVAALLAPSVVSIAAKDRLMAAPSTRVAASEWAQANLATAKVAEEWYCTYLSRSNDRFVRLTLSDRSIESYRSDGFDYIIVSSSSYGRFFVDPSRYPGQTSFYRSLAAHARLVATFSSDKDHRGPRIDVYDIRSPT